MIYGPLAHIISKPEDLNESNLRIYNLFFKTTKDAEMPSNGLPLYVDVRVSTYLSVPSPLNQHPALNSLPTTPKLTPP